MKRYLGLICLLVVLASCSSTSEPPAAPTATQGATTAPAANGEQPGYPAPAVAYPAPTTESIAKVPDGAYPPPAPTMPQGPKFTINTPLKAGATEVTGSGPAGLTIRVIDITMSGAELSTVTIAQDGTFTAKLTSALVAQNRIGLTLGEGGDRTKYVSGPGYEDLFMIGIVFTSERVSP